MLAVVVGLQQDDAEVAVWVLTVAGIEETGLVGLPLSGTGLGREVEVVVHITEDDVGLAVGTRIVDDDADERKGGLLHGETVHGILDIGVVIVGHTTYANKKVWIIVVISHKKVIGKNLYLAITPCDEAYSARRQVPSCGTAGRGRDRRLLHRGRQR